MNTNDQNFTLPNGCVLTPNAMEVLHKLQFNQGYNSHDGQKNQDVAMYRESISNIQDSLAENAYSLNIDDHDSWRKHLVHIADLADIKRLIKLFSHPEGD
jgi:hypothetical protein